MKTFRNKPACLFMTLLLLTLTSCFSVSDKGEDLIFFYFESCPSCDDYILAQDYTGMITRLNQDKKWKGNSYNLITSDAAEKLKETLQKKGLPDISRSLPLLILGNEYINGYEAIGRKLKDLSSEKP